MHYMMDEYGDPNDPAIAPSLLANSPYRGLRDAIDYPAVLIDHGRNDGPALARPQDGGPSPAHGATRPSRAAARARQRRPQSGIRHRLGRMRRRRTGLLGRRPGPGDRMSTPSSEFPFAPHGGVLTRAEASGRARAVDRPAYDVTVDVRDQTSDRFLSDSTLRFRARGPGDPGRPRRVGARPRLAAGRIAVGPAGE